MRPPAGRRIIRVLAKELSRRRTHARTRIPSRRTELAKKIKLSLHNGVNGRRRVATMNDGSCWKLPQHAAFVDGNIKSSNCSMTVSFFFPLHTHTQLLKLRHELEKSSSRHLTQADKISNPRRALLLFQQMILEQSARTRGHCLVISRKSKESATYCRHFYQYRRRLRQRGRR